MPTTGTITINALIKRINRRLAHEAKHLSVTRDSHLDQGRVCKYYIIDSRNYITGGDDDLGQLGRELGVLAEGEHLATA